MIVVAVDKKLNVERMLSTGKFQSEHWHADECLWLIYYLRENSVPENEIYEKWKFFWRQHKTTYDEEDLRLNYNTSFSKLANNVIFENLRKITIYQEEIDYINSLPIPLWIRQYIYLLLAHCKAKNTDKYDYLPYDEYHWLIDVKNKRYSDQKAIIADKLREFGILKTVYIKESHENLYKLDDDGFPVGIEYNVNVVDSKLQFRLPITIIDKKNKITYSTIMDAIKDMYRIHNRFKCIKCGKEFDFNLKTKRVLCDDCYKEERKRNISLAVKKFRVKQM